LNWRVLLVAAALVGLAVGFAPAFSQASPSGVAGVSLNHNYILSSFGYAVLNDSFTFSNNGTSPAQIPTLQVGLPTKASARISSLVLSPGNEFSLSQSQSGGNTSVTISPDQPTLSPGANITVALKGVLDNVLNFTNVGFGGTGPFLVMLSPSLNVNVTTLNSDISIPGGGQFLSIEPGYAASSAGNLISEKQTAVRPAASEVYLNFNATQAVFTPLTVYHLVRTIVPSANGSPMVEDQFSVHSVANYSISQIRLDLLNPSTKSVTEIPSTPVPVVNPQVVTLSSGDITFQTANIGAPLLANSNVTVTIEYPVPSSLIVVSGNTVKVTVPYTPLILAPVSNYTILLASARGVTSSGPTVVEQAVSPLSTGSVQFTYTVSVGWASDQALPAGLFVFAVAFAMFAIQRPSTSTPEEGEKTSRKTSDVLRSFDEKTALEAKDMEEFAAAPKGSISKADFDRMRNEVNELRSRAIQRLNEIKQVLGSGRQYDVWTRVADAEKEEDRAFRDLLNLYMQFHGNRMNEETFRRLQPNYRKRVDSAINRLSDLLHEAKTEEK
jgi:hypothetical protein